MEKYFNLMIRYTIELILFFDKDGGITLANRQAEQELGYEEGMLVGENISNIFPDVFGSLENQFCIKENLTGIINTTAYRKNHTCFSVDLSVKQGNEDFTHSICTAVNTKKRDEIQRALERAKEESQQVETMKNEFLANMTHELRTPLNGILGHVRNLIEESSGEQQHTLKFIESSCDNMNRIIDNILNFSKLESGKFILEEREFGFRDMMESVVKTHINAINQKGLTLQVNINKNIPDTIIGDDLRIMQILNNLISNAVKFTVAGKVVVEVIKTLQSNDELELFFLVIDSGIGISSEDTDKLFKSFSQVDASTTREYGGTGLGLAVCKELVELMRGSINVESNKNKGSIFSFSIMLKLPKDSAAEEGAVQNQESAKEKAIIAAALKETEAIYQYNTRENKAAIRDIMERLILCIEMDSWYKAEKLVEDMKHLLQEHDQQIRRAAFRMEMSVRKESPDSFKETYNILNDLLTEDGGAV